MFYKEKYVIAFSAACDTDFNHDRIINFIDISAFSNEFLGANPSFDISDDGFINFLEYSVVANSLLNAPVPGLGSCAIP